MPSMDVPPDATDRPITPTVDAASAALLQRYLDHVKFEKRLAERTCTLYRLDLERLMQMAQGMI